MKNESAQKQINNLNLAKCSKNNPATMVCSSQHCTNTAFVCNDDQCDCRASHKLCFQISISSIMKIILAHSFSLETLAQQIETLFDNAIDKLSAERDKILSEIQIQHKYQYLGLTQLQRKFVEVVKKGVKDDEINCKLIDKLYNQSKGQKTVNKTLNQGEKLIENMKQNLKQQYLDYTNDLKQFLQRIKHQQQITDIFLKSKIIKSGINENKLLGFFTEKKVQSANLLYRASQNEFSTIKWYEKCANISNTLTIVETQFGKVIGGFTTFKWVRNNEWISAVNDIKNHFLFSLTNNDIFKITQNAQYCIFGFIDNNFGPRFGGSADLHIYNKANQNNSSCSCIGFTFTNKNYVYNDTNSQINFSGGKNFKIKQWQVWEIIFHI